jgi:hypothetical protein
MRRTVEWITVWWPALVWLAAWAALLPQVS